MHWRLDNYVKLFSSPLVHLGVIASFDANHDLDPMGNDNIAFGMFACEMNGARTCG
jgi:hypothetical protein